MAKIFKHPKLCSLFLALAKILPSYVIIIIIMFIIVLEITINCEKNLLKLSNDTDKTDCNFVVFYAWPHSIKNCK